MSSTFPCAADGHEQHFGLDHLFLAPVVLDPHPHSGLGHVDVVRGRARSREDGDALSLEGADQHGRGFLVLGGDDASDQTDLRAVATIDRRPLHTDRPAAADDEALRQRLQHDRVVGIDDSLAIEWQVLDRPGARPGVDDDVAGGERERCAAASGGDLDLTGTGDPAESGDHGDLVLLIEEILQAFVLSVDDLVRPIQRRGVVERDVSGDVDAELRRVLDLLEDVRRLQKRLGRDTATVEAGAP